MKRIRRLRRTREEVEGMSPVIVLRTPKSEVFSESLEISLKYPFTRIPMETVLN